MDTSDRYTDTSSAQWDALLRAPMTETEVAFVPDPQADTDQIVVIYNARNAPPVVTIDADYSPSIFTLRADGAPLAVLSRDAAHVPNANDVVLVARHAFHRA
ncbi:MAG: hypothetical protein ACI9PY_003496 [Ascidiaceihabitans sp.]|jgi:hypothetical protein